MSKSKKGGMQIVLSEGTDALYSEKMFIFKSQNNTKTKTKETLNGKQRDSKNRG
jgi:hypothetical protein